MNNKNKRKNTFLYSSFVCSIRSKMREVLMLKNEAKNETKEEKSQEILSMNGDKEQFLLDELDSKIEDFRKDSNKHKNLYRGLRYSAFALTAILSILSGMALYYPEFSTLFNISILAISASAGFISSLEGIRKADELWIHERTIFYELSDVKRELEYELKGNKNREKILDEAFYRFQKILNNSGEKWSSGIVRGRQHDNEPV